MRLGIYGGTFDPVHYGHLLLAEQCREQCDLDEVWFVPARHPPHKDIDGISSASARVHMLEFALAGCPEFSVSPIELDREGPSYTVETLQQLVDEDASRELFLLLGADSLYDFPTWREPQRILQLAKVVVVNRGKPDLAALHQAAAALGHRVSERFQFVEMPAVALSASEIRSRVRGEQSIRFMTPRPVVMYISEHRLYRASHPT